MYRVDASFRKRFLAYARLFSDSRGTNHDALKCMREMKHHTQLTAELYNNWIDALAVAGERSSLASVLPEMRKLGLEPTQEHYKRLLFALSRSGDFRACEELAHDMKAHGFRPNSEFFDFLLTRNYSPQMEPVWHILRGENTQGKSTTPNISQATTNVGLDATPNSTSTEPVPPNEEMKSEKAAPPTPTFITNLVEKIRGASTQEIRELLREMRNMYANAALYNTLINHAPNESIAWLILNEMVAHGVRPTHFSFNALLRFPSLKSAKDVLVAMKKHGLSPDVVTYNQLMKLRVNDLDKQGCIAFREMMQKKQISPTVTTYNQMLHLARKLRDRIWYNEVKEDMQMNWIEPNAATKQLLEQPENPNYWKN